MLSRFPISRWSRATRPLSTRQTGRQPTDRPRSQCRLCASKAASARRLPIRFRITARKLIDTNTGKHVWADRYDKAGKDPLALQDEVTGKIIAAMTGETGQVKQGQYREAWGRDTADLGEYDYYLRGHDVFMNATSREENDRAGKIWEEGLTKYPI